MKTTCKFLSLVIISLLVLVACNKAPQPDTSTIPTGVAKDAMMETGEVADDTEGDMEAEVETEPKTEPRFERNLSCGEIKQERTRLACENQLNEIVTSLILAEARKYFDFSFCKQLPKSFVEECEIYINETGVKGPITEAEIAIYNEAIQPVRAETEEGESIIAALTSPTYDKTKCAQLTTSGLQEYCENLINVRVEQVKLGEIVNKGTVAECDQLTSEGLRTNCKFSFGVFGSEEEVEELSVPVDEEIEGGMEEAVDESI